MQWVCDQSISLRKTNGGRCQQFDKLRQEAKRMRASSRSACFCFRKACKQEDFVNGDINRMALWWS